MQKLATLLLMVAAVSAGRLTIKQPQSDSTTAAYGALPEREDVEAERNSDIITHLPGYQGPLTGEHRSGYITVDKKRGRKLFYYFVASEDDPQNDPFVLWMNGGPGCSSFDGFIYEMGPFTFSLTAANKVQLSDRPSRWNLKANVLYLESPAGVGFSSSRHRSDYVTNDTATTRDAEVFLRLWFQRHPQYLDNEFFITGESYAGIYVPLLALAVAEGNDAGRMPQLNIQGYAVGNGCTDERIDGNALPLFGVGKSLLPYSEYVEMQESCKGEFWNRTEGSKCDTLFNDLLNDVAGLNVYDVLEDCYHSPVPSTSMLPTARIQTTVQLIKGRQPVNTPLFSTWPLLGPVRPGPVHNWATLRKATVAAATTVADASTSAATGRLDSARIAGLKQTPPCTDSRQASLWLNNAEVRIALHADPLDESSDGPWDICSDRISYTHDAGSMIPIHKALLEKHDLRALIYSGDHDMAVPHTGSEAWTSELGREVVSPWQPWVVGDEQVAGYVVAYKGLTYATVKGAGHMVPETNPSHPLTEVCSLDKFVANPAYKKGGVWIQGLEGLEGRAIREALAMLQRFLAGVPLA